MYVAPERFHELSITNNTALNITVKIWSSNCPQCQFLGDSASLYQSQIFQEFPFVQYAAAALYRAGPVYINPSLSKGPSLSRVPRVLCITESQFVQVPACANWVWSTNGTLDKLEPLEKKTQIGLVASFDRTLRFKLNKKNANCEHSASIAKITFWRFSLCKCNIFTCENFQLLHRRHRILVMLSPRHLQGSLSILNIHNCTTPFEVYLW